MARAGLKKFALLALPVTLLVAIAAGWLYSRNSLFRLSEIVVEVDDAEIAATVRHKLMHHLGRSLFGISLAKVEDEVKELSSVNNAGIYRRWPSTLVVAIQLRKPVAMTFIKGKLWSLDAKGKAIELLVKPDAVLLLKHPPLSGFEREELFAWIDAARTQEPGTLDFNAIDELEWDAERGLIARNYERDLEIELGFSGFAQAWSRADQALAALKAKGLYVNFLDATYRHRVVVRGGERLQNLTNGLNLKGLSHRAAPSGAAQAR